MREIVTAKKVLVLCGATPTRGRIISIVSGKGYNVIRVGNNVEALESLRKSGVADLVVIGQHENASILIEWIERNFSGMPKIFIRGCECESKKIAHTDYEIDESELENQLPALIERKIGPPKPLSQ